MKSKLVFAALMTVFMIGAVSAQSNTTQDFNVEEYNLSEYEDTINTYSDELPGWIKDLIGDQNINIYIDEGSDDATNISIKMNGMKVDEIDDSALENPDIEVWTSTDVIEKVVESDKPVDEMRTAIDEGEIDYQANGTWNKVKVFFAEMLFKYL
ncbi:hypothetical protein [Candidatus Nanohalovita haloferacivicina]|uniref:hypothetical protein n=1 Tax=Candidatus Nanohalovita haloferacivicina TaxID=2978046 RepID=UPI00325F98F7|nr:Uncharacterized protein HBNXNv_0601 [Candidatus Nanohalobia archaeon BNXNv]